MLILFIILICWLESFNSFVHPLYFIALGKTVARLQTKNKKTHQKSHTKNNNNNNKSQRETKCDKTLDMSMIR